MKLMIEIDNEEYKGLVTEGHIFVKHIFDSVRNGTPIPDNATVGEVFCMLACKEPICETASYFTIDKKLWNAPYQKGGTT